ncbi:unnamed protein product [Diatraea saccharalis]|uniref:Uncharacterized protein n=1 Tax=Diatraea saccharalis TaxID=40085 RepID=A0A9N9WC66_9NEOP|nr:unnamed protein product [Diatraea saccharalis]
MSLNLNLTLNDDVNSNSRQAAGPVQMSIEFCRLVVASCLQHNRSLRRLALSNVSATRVCVDWLRDMPHLQRLDLTRNNVTELVFSDLNRMKRNDDNSVIDLSHNPVRAVDATAEDYEASLHERPDTQGTVLLDSDFVCDCTAFWFWRALRAGRVVVRMEPRCAGGGALRELRPAAMRCAVHQARCAPCSCHAALLDAGAARLHVTCAGAPPARLLLHPPSPIRALTLAGAGLTAAPDLPPLDLQWLDLDNNSISRVDAALFERARRVRLTRNPLACDCAPHSALPLLRRYRHQLEYFNETRCADGTLAADALRMQCGADEGAGAGAGAGWGGGAAAAALGAGAAAAALLALLLAREPLRLRLKVRGPISVTDQFVHRYIGCPSSKPSNCFGLNFTGEQKNSF